MIRDVLTLSKLRQMPPDEAAALWTSRFAEGRLPHEAELFEQWLGLAPENRREWDRAQSAWGLFEGAADDELLEAMLRHARRARPQRWAWQRLGAVAALLLVITIGSVVAERSGLFGPGRQVTTPMAPGNGEVLPASFVYANGREMPKVVELPDGSRMTLDAETRVSARFAASQRSFKVLGGRVLFAVRHDASRPFVVQARSIAVTAIGTRFDVALRTGEVRVFLVEGRLAVNTANATARPLVMSAGQQLVAGEGEQPLITSAATNAPLDWEQGFATFDDETLADAAALLNRYPGDRLIVRDPHIAELKISGNFKVGDPERFGRTLAEIYPVQLVRRNANELEIVPRS